MVPSNAQNQQAVSQFAMGGGGGMPQQQQPQMQQMVPQQPQMQVQQQQSQNPFAPTPAGVSQQQPPQPGQQQQMVVQQQQPGSQWGGQMVPQQQQQMVPAQQQQQQQQQDDDDFFGMFSANAATKEPEAPVSVVDSNNATNVNDSLAVASRSSGAGGALVAASAAASATHQGASGSDGLTSRGKQLYREDVDPEDKDRALAAAPPSTELVVSTAASQATYAPPPPMSTTSQYGRVIAQTTQLPNAAPLPDREQVLHSGYVLSRISFRTILMKKWKQTFWIQYGPSSVLFFRNASDYEDWVNNPYLNNSQRDFLVKLQIDFVGDLTKINVRGYQVTHIRMKAYKGKML